MNARLHVDSSLENGILIYDASGVSISNITLIGSAPSPAAAVNSGILLWSDLANATQALSNGVTIQDVQASGFVAGITIGASGCGGFRGVAIQRALLVSNVFAGLESYGDYTADCYSHGDVTVADVFALNNTGNASATDGNSGSGIMLAAVDGALITRCLAAWNGAANGHVGGGPVGIWTWNARNVTISRCVAAGNMAGGVAAGTQAQYTDGGGFDLDGGTSDSVIEYSLAFRNAGPGFLVCQFGGYVRPTTNNTVRYSVSINDTQTSINAATGLNFYTPDASLAGVTVTGNTFIGTSASQRPQAALSGGAPLINVTLAANAFLSLGSAPGATLSLPPMPALAANGNAYWPPLWQYDGVDYSSLPAFRAGSGLEVAANGAPTGTAADPMATWAASGGFFAGCIPWALEQDILALPSLPNSPLWDSIRGFSGCE